MVSPPPIFLDARAPITRQGSEWAATAEHLWLLLIYCTAVYIFCNEYNQSTQLLVVVWIVFLRAATETSKFRKAKNCICPKWQKMDSDSLNVVIFFAD
jgi:hypothetical protein